MNNNWAFLIWIAITGFLGVFLDSRKIEYINGKDEVRTKMSWAILMFTPVAWGAATRGLDQGDTGTYHSMFSEVPDEMSTLLEYIEQVDRDIGYVLVEGIFKSLVGDRFYLFIALIAIFCSLAIITVYRRYSCSYIISIFLFVAGFDYFQWLFNGMRQFIAVAIILLCTKDMIEGNYKRLIIPLLIAASIHMSVLIVVPCLFFVKGSAVNKRIMFFVFGGVLLGGVLGRTGQLNEIIASLMESTQYDSVLDEFLETMTSGVNVLRVLVYSIPSILAIIGLRYIRDVNDPTINFVTNMSMISTGIYIISMFTSAIMIGRLPIYFSIYNYILLPWELKNMFTDKSTRLIIMMMVGFYLVYNYYQVVMVYGQPLSLGFLNISF